MQEFYTAQMAVASPGHDYMYELFDRYEEQLAAQAHSTSPCQHGHKRLIRGHFTAAVF